MFGPLVPRLPKPVVPRDIYAGTRDIASQLITGGDPTASIRTEQAASEIFGATGPSMVGNSAVAAAVGTAMDAGRAGAFSDFNAEQVAQDLTVRMQGVQMYNEATMARQSDMEQYRNLKAAHAATEAVMKNNARMGLLGAGIGLLGAVAGGPLGGTIAGGVGALGKKVTDARNWARLLNSTPKPVGQPTPVNGPQIPIADPNSLMFNIPTYG